MRIVAALSGVVARDLANALVTNILTTRGETIVTKNTLQQARDTRDALAKVGRE